MIYTITFNPSLDYVVSVENFLTGKLNRTKTEAIFPGGKGLNVSMVLSELGVENTALGFIAGFTGLELQKRLQDMHIVTDFISVKDGITRINMKLRSTASEKNEGSLADDVDVKAESNETEINGQGPIITEEELNQLVDKIHALTEEDIQIP